MRLGFTAWLDRFDLDTRLRGERVRGEEKHGKLQSAHEIYAVLKNELEEFWDSIKEHDPDPYELLQIAAVAYRGIEDLCEQARQGVIR
jgi:hypothetical protein